MKSKTNIDLLKSFIIILGFLSLAACSTTSKSKRSKSRHQTIETDDAYQSEDTTSEGYQGQGQAHWSRKYVGIKGFLRRPPLFASQAEAKKYNRCSALRILHFEETPGEVTMIVEQDRSKIKVVGLNRELFNLSNESRIKQLDKHFVKKLDVIQSSRKLARATDYLCKGQAWKYMSKEQFLFIHGSPDKILKGSGKYKDTYQWVYQSDDKSNKKSYYFTNDLLWAWN